jgi:hypothetical protein
MKAKDGALGLLLALFIAMGITAATPIQQTNRKADTLPSETGTIAGGFKLSLTVDKHKFASGEAIMLKVSLRNTTNAPLHIMGTIFDVDCQTEVRNDKGELVPLTEYAKHLPRMNGIHISMGRISIGAGQEAQEALQVNRLYEMSAPGEYSIVLRRGVPGWVRGQPEVVSNKVALRVVGDAEQSSPPDSH